MNETNKHAWDKFWQQYNFCTKENKNIIHQEICSVRWKKIQKEIIDRFGDFKGLKVVEIGSGRGELAAIMALRGADVTLIDYSEVALEKAKMLFDHLDVKANFLCLDIFDLPSNLFGCFDISMSFGLAEHFRYPQRLEVIKLHSNLIKNNGVSFVAVPNAYCWPYRFFITLYSLLGYSHEADERPFTHKEFKKIALSTGFKKYKIFGSSLLKDSAYFLLTRYISHLTKWKIIIDTSFLEIPTVLDDHYGYSIVFTGSKV